MANQLTSLRIILAIFSVFTLSLHSYFSMYIIALIPLVMILDLFDGLIARKLGEASVFGSVFDIAADRFIEMLYLIFFACHGLIGFWVVFVMLCRGMTVDTIRSLRHFNNKTAFGAQSFHKTKWAYYLTTCHLSRGIYNGLKTIAFTALALAMYQKEFLPLAIGLTYISVLMALLRSLPVIFESVYIIKLLNQPSHKV